MMNLIKVNANFLKTTDANLDLYGLRVNINYSIPSVFGFTKTKVIQEVLIDDTTINKFLGESERIILTGEIKKTIRGLVEKDIMKRLLAQYENKEDKVNNILNALNQMKFDFTMDIQQAEKTAINANDVAFPCRLSARLGARNKPQPFQHNVNDEIASLFD